jgi:hypothetical protein
VDIPKSVARIQAAKAKKRMGKIELRRFSTVNLSLAKRVCWSEKKGAFAGQLVQAL